MSKKLQTGKLSPQEELILKKTMLQAKDLVEKRVEEQNKLSSLYQSYMNIE